MLRYGAALVALLLFASIPHIVQAKGRATMGSTMPGTGVKTKNGEADVMADLDALRVDAYGAEETLRSAIKKVIERAEQKNNEENYDKLREMVVEGVPQWRRPLATRLRRYCLEHEELCESVFESGMDSRASKRVGKSCMKDSECWYKGAPLVCCIDIVENTLAGSEGGTCALPSQCPMSQSDMKYLYRTGLEGGAFAYIREEMMGGSPGTEGIDWREKLEEYQCDSGTVRSQGPCGTCSGMSVSTSYSQRLCLFSKNHDANVVASVNDLSELIHIMYKKKDERDSYIQFRRDQVAALKDLKERESSGILTVSQVEDALYELKRKGIQSIRNAWYWKSGDGGMRMAWLSTLMGDGPDAVPDAAAVIPENCHPYGCMNLSPSVIEIIAQTFAPPRVLNAETYAKAKESYTSNEDPWGVLRESFQRSAERKRVVKALSDMSFMRPTVMNRVAKSRCDSQEIPLRTDTSNRSGHTFFVSEWRSTTRWEDVDKLESRVDAPFVEYPAMRAIQPMRNVFSSMRLVDEELRENGPISFTVNIDWLNSQPTVEGTHNGQEIKIIVPTSVAEAKINHAMVLLGWVYSSELSYWVIQNSWGSGDDNKGYIYVQRGYNKDCFGGAEDRPSVCGIDFLHALSPVIQSGSVEMVGLALSAQTLSRWDERSDLCRRTMPHGCGHGHFGSECDCRCNMPFVHDVDGMCTQCGRTCENGEVDGEACTCTCNPGYWGDRCELTLEYGHVCRLGEVADGEAPYRVHLKLVGRNAAWPEHPAVHAYQIDSEYNVVKFASYDIIGRGGPYASPIKPKVGHVDLPSSQPGSTWRMTYTPVALNEFQEKIAMESVTLPHLEIPQDAELCEDPSI